MIETESASSSYETKEKKRGGSRFVKIAIPFLILAALIGLRIHVNHVNNAALDQAAGQMKGKGTTSVAVAPVAVRDIVHTFSTTANIESPQTVKLSPNIAGQIVEIAVKEGDSVHQGEVLARLNPLELQATVQQKRAMLAGARAKLLQAQASQTSVLTPIATQIVQNKASVQSAQANYNQLRDTFTQQMAAADAAVTDAQSRVANAQATVENAQAALRSAQANLLNATTSLGRQKSLLSQGAVAQQDVDNAQTAADVQNGNVGVANAQVNAAQAAVRSAEAQLTSAQNQDAITHKKNQSDIEAAHASLVQTVQQLRNSNANTGQRAAYQANLASLNADVMSAQADLSAAQVQLGETVLRSPIDGFVSSRLADPGTLASPGTPVLNVQALRQVWVNVPVPQEQIQQVSLGQQATVTIDSIAGKTFTGRVFQINPSGDAASRNFTIRVALDNQGGLLKPGMFARVSLVTQHVSSAIVIPLEAIQTDDTGASFVWVLNEDSTVAKTPVTLGASDDNGTAVLSGLNPGQQVVTVNGARLKDGGKVVIGGVGGKGGKGGKAGGHHHKASS